MSGYFDWHANQLRRNPGAILEIEEEVWADVLRTINMSGFPKKYRLTALKMKEMYMFNSTYEDEFTVFQKDTHTKNRQSLFIEKMHDLFHEVREFAERKRMRNRQKYSYDWDNVTFKPIEEYLP